MAKYSYQRGDGIFYICNKSQQGCCQVDTGGVVRILLIPRSSDKPGTISCSHFRVKYRYPTEILLQLINKMRSHALLISMQLLKSVGQVVITL